VQHFLGQLIEFKQLNHIGRFIMKNPLNRNKVLVAMRVGAFCLPVLLAGMPASGVAGQGILGDLTAQGPIQVTGGVPNATITVTNDSYAYFSGDHISTGQGSAILSVASIGKIGLDKDTAAKISGSEQSLAVVLEKGTVLYSVKLGSQLRINAAGLTVTPASAPITKVAQKPASADPSAISGWVSVSDGGLVQVSANTGQARISHGGQIMNVVQAGTVDAFQREGGQFVRVQAQAIKGTPRTDLRNRAIALGVLGAVTVGAVVATSNDNGGSPASP
jgi:hypothetical protein